MARHCPECGFVVTEGANYCQRCGAYVGVSEDKRDDATTATYMIDENTGELKPVDVGSGDDFLAALVLLAQPVHELSAQDVDLAVEDPTTVRHLLLFVSELLDEVLELLVGERTQIGEGVHVKRRPLLGGRDGTASIAFIKLN